MRKKPTPPPEEDEEQSRRFVETVRELEAAGDLSLTEGEQAFEDLVGKIVPTRLGTKEE